MSSTIKRTFNFLGEKVTVEITVPTNEEHNAYMAKRMQIDVDADLPVFRAGVFDKLYISGSKPKEEIYDTAKSAVIFQLFENFAVDPKN